ncbi:uncharacterized protein DS421_3g82510 [Arachis hypogaea]|nr:uncharacterized protein DS421_3g82510 [Arachis hypogaea]
MRVTHCDKWASVFVVEELEPFEGWGEVHSVFDYRMVRVTAAYSNLSTIRAVTHLLGERLITRSHNQTSFSVNDSFLCAACCAATEGVTPSSCSTMAYVSMPYHLPKSRKHPSTGFPCARRPRWKLSNVKSLRGTVSPNLASARYGTMVSGGGSVWVTHRGSRRRGLCEI